MAPSPRTPIVAIAPRPAGVKTAACGESEVESRGSVGMVGCLSSASWYDKSFEHLDQTSMLLRWLVNQYLRDGADGKMRAAISELIQPPAASRPPTPVSRALSPEPRIPTP